MFPLPTPGLPEASAHREPSELLWALWRQEEGDGIAFENPQRPSSLPPPEMAALALGCEPQQLPTARVWCPEYGCALEAHGAHS